MRFESRMKARAVKQLCVELNICGFDPGTKLDGFRDVVFIPEWQIVTKRGEISSSFNA